MADRKISELTNITGANLADTDEFVVVDTSASETKAITYGELKKFTGTVTADGLTVEDADGATIRIQSSDTSVDGGSLGQLEFYSNDASTGGTGVKGKIQVSDNGSTGQNYEMNFFTGYVTGGAHAETKKMSIGPYGDISFYEATGTTPKMVWSASSESLGIGTASPLYPLSVRDPSFGTVAEFRTIDGTNNPGLEIKTSASGTTLSQVYSSGASANLILETNAAERMRIDSSGNVGIGTSSPSSYNSGGYRLVVGDGAGFEGMTIASGSAQSGNIYFADGTTGNATYRGHISYDHSDDHMHFKTAASERMRIDSSGNVGIDFIPKTMTANVTSSLNVGSGTVFQRTKNTYLGSNMYYNASDVGKSISTGYGLAYLHDVTNGAHKWYTSAVSAGSADATHSFSTPMTLDASGSLLVGTSSLLRTGYVQHIRGQTSSGGGIVWQSFDTVTAPALAFTNSSATLVGTIQVTTTATSFNTSSDYRLKEDVQPMVGASDRVMSLNPVNFAWKADGTRTDGFLAHEAQAVAPYAVTGEKDGEEMQSIDHSKLVPLLTAALQEALGRIETLEAEVAALKA